MPERPGVAGQPLTFFPRATSTDFDVLNQRDSAGRPAPPAVAQKSAAETSLLEDEKSAAEMREDTRQKQLQLHGRSWRTSN